MIPGALEEIRIKLEPHSEKDARRERVRGLVAEYGGFICRSLRHLGIREPDLDDAVQDVFLVVCRRLGDYQERGLTRSWLYSICSRVAKELRRGRRRELVTGEKFDWATEPTQLESLQDREALAFGHSLLEQLPLNQREVFVLYEIEDMSGPEIAQALGCPLQTVYSRLNSARARVLSSVRLAELRTSAARARFTPDS